MSVLGIDIGVRYIKIVVANSVKRRGPMKTFLLNTPKGVLRDGELIDAEPVAEAILNLIHQNGIKAKELYIAVKSSRMTSRDIHLPALKFAEVPPAIEFDLSQSFPGIQLTHTISYIQDSKQGEPITGLAVFCPARLIEGYQTLADRIGVPLIRVDANFNAAARATRLFLVANAVHGTVVMVDIGEESSQAMILSNGKILINRHIPGGIVMMDTVLSSRIGVSAEEAADIRRNNSYSEHGVSDEDVTTLFRIGCSAITDQVRQVLDFFQYNYKDTDPVSSLILTGGGSMLSGISKHFTESFSMPVKHLNNDIGSVAGMSGSFYLAAAGMVVSDTRLANDVNLLPKEHAQKASKIQNTQKWIAGGVAGGCLLLFLMLLGALSLGMNMQEQRKQALTKSTATYAKVNEVKSQIAEKEAQIKDIKQLIEVSDARAMFNTTLLGNLAASMPEGLFIQNYTIDESDAVSLSGIAKTRPDVAKFVNGLRNYDCFSNISVQSVTAKLNTDGTVKDYNFSISISAKPVGSVNK